MKKFIKKIKSNKFLYILSVLIIGVFLALIFRMTYAFLAPIINEAQSNIAIKGDTVDDFDLKVGSALKLNATPTTLKENGTNYTTSTTATASLKANSTKNTATYNYYLYFQLENNTFTYTDGSTPEIILTITNPNGEEVTSIEGLTYGTLNGVSGFDITTQNGLFKIANNYSITSNSSTTFTNQVWNITLTYLNLSFDQSSNFGKSMSANVMIQKNKLPEIVSDVCSGGENLATCITTLSNKSSFSLTNIYHHDASLTNGAGDNSYRYAGGDYVLTEAGKATGATMMIGYNNTVTTALIDFYCNGTKQYVGYTCDASQAHYYLIKGDTTQYQTYKETLNKAVEKGYLTKDNVKNFVCFGSNTSPCPTENLYRIIGLIDGKIKLISADGATTDMLGTDGGYYKTAKEQGMPSNYYKGSTDFSKMGIYQWNSTGTSTWSTSTTNTTNLNKNFLAYLDSKNAKWKNMIADTTWYVGGMTADYGNKSNAKTAYNYEVGANKDASTTVTSKIGMMYLSDYYYAASKEYWTLPGYNSSGNDYRKATNDNWLYTGLYDWTISRVSAGLGFAFAMIDVGRVDWYGVSGGSAVRPSFSLTSSVQYVSGSGTSTDPIRIN